MPSLMVDRAPLPAHPVAQPCVGGSVRTGRALVVLVPAHDEESQIGATIDSLLTQRRRPDTIIVVADNCSDGTVQVARSRGVRVIETVGNTGKKAGALNQALEQVLPGLDDDDMVLVMDADSALDAEFLRAGERRLARGDVAAVGGTFLGQPGGGLVGMLQRNEYARYARDVRRRKGKVLVLTGTATLFRAGVLRQVRDARGDGRLPGGVRQVYDTRVLTEDCELTLALLHLGHRIVSPKECSLTTEVMPTWSALFQQRLRWKRGALENLRDYGLTRITAEYWARQVLTAIGILVTATYLATVVGTLATTGTLRLHAIWLVVTVVFMVERVVTVRRRGWVQMAVAATLLVEMVFDVFLQVAQARAYGEALFNAERRW